MNTGGPGLVKLCRTLGDVLDPRVRADNFPLLNDRQRYKIWKTLAPELESRRGTCPTELLLWWAWREEWQKHSHLTLYIPAQERLRARPAKSRKLKSITDVTHGDILYGYTDKLSHWAKVSYINVHGEKRTIYRCHYPKTKDATDAVAVELQLRLLLTEEVHCK